MNKPVSGSLCAKRMAVTWSIRSRRKRKPKANAEYWTAKIDRNRARDARVEAGLILAGWRVLSVWECELREPGFAARLTAAVKAQAASSAD